MDYDCQLIKVLRERLVGGEDLMDSTKDRSILDTRQFC
jgi:hypothetical protein